MRLIALSSETDFAGWRAAARVLRREGVAPKDVAWSVGEGRSVAQDSRISDRGRRREDPAPQDGFTVPRAFVDLASRVIRHRSPDRFGLLYRLLWRLSAAPRLLADLDDPDVARARVLAAEVIQGRNLAASSGISPAEPPLREPPVTANPPRDPVSPRAVKAAQRHMRDGAYGCDAPTALEDIAAGVDSCRRCDLWRGATQGVAGEGPARARLMFVGEQPGDQEDLAGRPFVGPAGVVFDKALVAAGVPREATYVTNAVKHFKHELRGKRRIHKTPNAGEVEACRWWLDAERRLVRPRVIVVLGATAALAVLGRPTPIAANRGRAHQLPDQAQAVVTYHPSYLLRVPDERARAEAHAAFLEDLRLAWRLSGEAEP